VLFCNPVKISYIQGALKVLLEKIMLTAAKFVNKYLISEQDFKRFKNQMTKAKLSFSAFLHFQFSFSIFWLKL